jgi:hypothetical protein
VTAIPHNKIKNPTIAAALAVPSVTLAMFGDYRVQLFVVLACKLTQHS